MPKCPRCGSTAQVKVTGTNFDYVEMLEEIAAMRAGMEEN